MPKRHTELDASQYISVFLLNEIARLMENDEEINAKTQCVRSIDRFPHKVWKIASDLVKDCEEYYMNNTANGAEKSEDKEFKEEKPDQDNQPGVETDTDDEEQD